MSARQARRTSPPIRPKPNWSSKWPGISGAPLYLRYQTTQERALHKYAEELRKLSNERRKAEIGFASQKRRETEDTRREAAEDRRQELHKWDALQPQAASCHS